MLTEKRLNIQNSLLKNITLIPTKTKMLVRNLFKFKKLMKYSLMMKNVNNMISLDMDLREEHLAVVDFMEVVSLVDLTLMTSLVNSLVVVLVVVVLLETPLAELQQAITFRPL